MFSSAVFLWFFDKYYSSTPPGVINDYLTWFFGVTLTVLCIWTVIITIALKKISYQALEFYIAVHATYLFIGAFAISYDLYYFTVAHPFVDSMAYVLITQGIFWTIYIGLFSCYSLIKYRPFVIKRKLSSSEKTKYYLLGLFIGVGIVGVGYLLLEYINYKIFNNVPETRESMNAFVAALFMQICGGHFYQKVYYMNKFKEHVGDQPESMLKFIAEKL